MPQKTKRKIKTYYVQITAEVVIDASIEIEAYSKEDAISRAEEMFENNLECSSYGFEDVSPYVQDMTSSIDCSDD